MARYALTNGDRITQIVEWDGKSPHPYSGFTPQKLPDNASAEWIGKSYAEAVRAGNTAKDTNGELHPAKDAREGQRADALKAAEGGLHASGEALNTQMGDATMAMEHPLDPVLGSEMRTSHPGLKVAIVPASQPKTAAQTAKDAGEPHAKVVPGSKERHAPATNATTADNAEKRAIAAAAASDTMDTRKKMASVE